MRISVVIPTWRRPDCLGRCLDGLERQNRIPDEVIVVVRKDDAETRTLLDARSLGGLTLNVATVHEAGLVAALNRGLETVTNGAVALTDDDTVPRSDWLERIERHFVADPRLGGLGGRDWLHPPSGETGETTVGKLQWYGRVVGNHHLGVGPSREVDVLKGANMSYRVDALNGVRVDERLRGAAVQLHTEVDLCLALSQAGWKLLYDPAVSVDHYPAPRFEDDSRFGPAAGVTLEHVIHNQTYLLLKWLPWWRKVSAVVYWLLVGTRNAPGLLLLAERLVRRSDRMSMLHRYRATLKGRWAGVRTFIGAR